MQADMDSYVMPSAQATSSSQESCISDSVTQSSSNNTDPCTRDPDSVSSKDGAPEKHTFDNQEKEKDMKNVNKNKEDEGIVKNLNKSNSKEDQAVFTNSKLCTSKLNAVSRKRTSSTDHSREDAVESGDVPCKKRLLSGSSILDDSIRMSENSGLTVNQLIEHVQTVKKKGLLTEYAHIRMEPHAGTFKHSRARHNLSKNRYTDVLCYDHSRVKLAPVVGVPGSDYINANFVDGYMQKKAYISTQGPLPRTFADFWRMLWQNQCQVIVMTTRTVERQRVKCGQYWPHEEQSEEHFEEFVIFNNSVNSFDNYLETKLVVHNSKTGESREISHLQFIGWPDYSVPPAASFLDFLFHVRSVQETATKKLGSSWAGHPLGPPMIVHCSAGIGRTGTFITVDISLRRLEDTGTIDVPATVRQIRSQRASSIQMPDQYVFCHLAIIEHAIHTGMVRDMESFVLDSSESDSE